MANKLFTLLKQDHKEAKDIFKQLSTQESMDRDLVHQVCEALALHMEIEEKFFYPALAKASETESLAEEAELEHAEAKKLMRDLMKKELSDPECKVKVEMLQLGIEHHIKEEEGELFPQAETTLGKEALEEIAQQAMALKEKKQAKMVATADI